MVLADDALVAAHAMHAPRGPGADWLSLAHDRQKTETLSSEFLHLG
jgi:hypothetical protein